MPEAVIIDYGVGNLLSLKCALEKVGLNVRVGLSARQLKKADAVALPGVGSFPAAAAKLDVVKQELIDTVESGVPLLGICLGFQLFFPESEEGNGRGLSLFEGKNVKLPSSVKVPHMGWNTLKILRQNELFDGVDDGSYVYFVHSMYPALYFMRNISRQLEQMASKKIGFLIFLIKGIFLRTRWNITFGTEPMQQAARIGKSLARRIRYMVLTGMLLYRENVFAKQFFLRRITHLSLYLFAIVAMLARIEASRHVGDRIEEDLKLLELFSEQARQVSKKNFRLLPSREECLNDDIMTFIIPEEQNTE